MLLLLPGFTKPTPVRTTAVRQSGAGGLVSPEMVYLSAILKDNLSAGKPLIYGGMAVDDP